LLSNATDWLENGPVRVETPGGSGSGCFAAVQRVRQAQHARQFTKNRQGTCFSGT